jgi:hypothetical protein
MAPRGAPEGFNIVIEALHLGDPAVILPKREGVGTLSILPGRG